MKAAAGFISALAMSCVACSPIRPAVVDTDGTITVHVVSMTTFVIDEHSYPTESAIYALSQLRERHQASKIAFLIDAALLAHPVPRSDPMYESFKSCSEIERRAYFVAHDSGFGMPEHSFAFDAATGGKGPPTKCDGLHLSIEM